MNRVIKSLFSLFMFAIIMSAIAATLFKMAGVPPIVTGILSVAIVLVRAYLSMTKFNRDYSNGRYQQFNRPVANAVQVEIWAKYIMGAIFKNNEFMNYAFNADDNVMQGKVVHIPQAGGVASVQKNRSSLPANVNKRSDTDVTYTLDEFTTDPSLIPNADTVELSYDKMGSVMKDDMNALRQTVAENLLISWAPTVTILRTTGKAIDPYLPAQTGQRNAIWTKDFMAAQLTFNGQSMPTEGRYALLSANFYNQLVDSLSETQYRDFSRSLDAAKGVVGELYGFKILMRSTVFVYDVNGVVKAYGAAGATDDNDAALFWHEDAVERAVGEIKVFDQANAPQYYGDLMSFLMRMGGRIRRADEKGILAMIQGVAIGN